MKVVLRCVHQPHVLPVKAENSQAQQDQSRHVGAHSPHIWTHLQGVLCLSP